MDSRAGNVKTMKLRYQDIVCAGCAGDMEKVLRERKGVIDASADYAEATLSVTYDAEVIERREVYIAARRLGVISSIISES